MESGIIMKPSKTPQSGSVLLEALIAILIFSIGILALIGMQATAINSVADAKYRSTAGFLANQIIGTIWATRAGTVNANVANVLVSTPDPTFCIPNACYGAAAGNTYTQAWIASGVAQLPSGTANITITDYPPANPVASMVTVTINWTPPKHDSSPGVVTHQHVVSAFIN